MQSGAPRRRPMATQIVLSSIQRPRGVTNKVCNQAPDSYLEADESLALDKGSGLPRAQWKKPLVDPMNSVNVTLARGRYDQWTI